VAARSRGNQSSGVEIVRPSASQTVTVEESHRTSVTRSSGRKLGDIVFYDLAKDWLE